MTSEGSLPDTPERFSPGLGTQQIEKAGLCPGRWSCVAAAVGGSCAMGDFCSMAVSFQLPTDLSWPVDHYLAPTSAAAADGRPGTRGGETEWDYVVELQEAAQLVLGPENHPSRSRRRCWRSVSLWPDEHSSRARAEVGMDGLLGQAWPEGGSDVSQPLAEEPQNGVGVEAQTAIVAADLPGNYFEIYKIAVEMADRISARRGLANSFFLTINTVFMRILGRAMCAGTWRSPG
jgi:hypothetical protein